jgi:hypothetical protein
VLTVEQRNGWAAFAQTHQFTNVFGDAKPLPANSMYASVNQRVLLCGGSPIDDAPQEWVVPDLGTVTIIMTAAGGVAQSVSIVCEHELPYGGGLYVQATRCFGWSRKLGSGMFRLVNLAERLVFASGVDFALDYNLRFPDQPVYDGFPVGFAVAAIDLSTGALGVGVTSTVEVQAA